MRMKAFLAQSKARNSSSRIGDRKNQTFDGSRARLLQLLLLVLTLIWSTDGGTDAGTISSYDESMQEILSRSIIYALKNKRFFNLTSNSTWSTHHTMKDTASSISTLCSNDPELTKRIGCCKPTDTRYIWNTKVDRGAFHLYTEHKADKEIPKVKERFGMSIAYHPQQTALDPAVDCTSYFNGTLHVIGLSTIENVFHIFADNILNHFASILLDHYFYPDMLHLPRKLLVYPRFNECPGGCRNPLPHMDILLRTFAGGSITPALAEGMCFRRVVWGQGSVLK